jgi:hypothetical protein
MLPQLFLYTVDQVNPKTCLSADHAIQHTQSFKKNSCNSLAKLSGVQQHVACHKRPCNSLNYDHNINPNTNMPACPMCACCRKEAAQILDIADRAAQRWEVSYTHFITPPVAADALAALSQRADVKAVVWGGYPQAERCRIAMGKEEVMLTAVEDPATLDDAVAALDVKGNFMFDPATHRDFLGAILGTDVARDRVGVSHHQVIPSCHPVTVALQGLNQRLCHVTPLDYADARTCVCIT